MPEAYARLGPRISTWIANRAAVSILLDIDLRLRPSAEAGLLASSIEPLGKYPLHTAWVWEHQALTRARFSAGDRRVAEQFDAIRSELLSQTRDLAALQQEILAMWRRMLEAHANKSALFDLTHDRGGLIDVEFIVPYLGLGYARRHRERTANRGNIALLALAGSLGLITAPLAERVRDAYRQYRTPAARAAPQQRP